MFEFLLINGFRLLRCPIHQNLLIERPTILEMALNEYGDIFRIDLLHEAAQYYICKRNFEKAEIIVRKLLDKRIIDQEKAILDYNFKIKAKLFGTESYRPLVMLAVEANSLEFLEKLLEYGFCIESEDVYGWTGVIAASACGYAEILKFLISRGTQISKKDVYGKTALHLAAQNGHLKIVEILVEHKIFLSLQDKNQKTPLDLACVNNHTEIYSLLKEKGALNGINCLVF